MKKRIRKIAVIFMASVLVLAMTAVAFATEEEFAGDEELLENVLLPDDEVMEDIPVTRSADVSYSANFVKNSSTKATANIDYICFEKADTMTSTITLQVCSSSGNYVDTSAAPAVQSAYNTMKIKHRAVFKISSGKKYRIKMACKVTIGKTPTTRTFYKNLV